MASFTAVPLRKLKGFWRVDGVSQVVEADTGLMAKIVLSQLRDDFSDPYALDARLDIAPAVLTLHPQWLGVLTTGSIWESGKFHSRPEPLPGLFTVDTSLARNYTFGTAAQLNGKWTKAGIAAADFLPKQHYDDLYATLYCLAPIIGDPTYKWMVIPTAELLRFYMGRSGRLLTKVLRGETRDLLTWPIEEDHQTKLGEFDLYEKKTLTEQEAQVLGRAIASKVFKTEMLRTNKKITEASASNSLLGTRSALAIDANFPFKGITNLSISGQAMRLANDQAIFAMTIHNCTFPLEFSFLTVHGQGKKKVKYNGGEKSQGVHYHFNVPEYDPDEGDEDDENIDDVEADATLKRRPFTQSASPFAGSSEVVIHYHRPTSESPGTGSSSTTDVIINGQSLGDGGYKASSQGTIGADHYLTYPHPPSSNLTDFFVMLGSFRTTTKPRGWHSTSIKVNNAFPVESAGNADTTKDVLTFLPLIPGNKRKWHLVANSEFTRPRQLACIRVASSMHKGSFFYILELELKDSESGQCTAIIRGRNYEELAPRDFNDLLKLTCYLKRWPDLVTDTWNKKSQRALAVSVSEKLVISKFVHPRNRSTWASQLIEHIDKWLNSRLPPPLG